MYLRQSTCQLLSIMMKMTILSATTTIIIIIIIIAFPTRIDIGHSNIASDMKLKEQHKLTNINQHWWLMRNRDHQWSEEQNPTRHQHGKNLKRNHQQVHQKVQQQRRLVQKPRTLQRRNILEGDLIVVDDDGDRHNKDPDEENKSNPPSPPEFTYIPSVAPSTHPSFKPTSLLSLVPSYQPSSSPSIKPTKSPTVNPSIGPTSNPTRISSSSPTCYDKNSGEKFGNTDDIDPIIVSYFYAMETDPNSNDSIESDVLPNVEEAVAGMLAKSFLGIACGAEIDDSGRDSSSGNQILGLSSKPEDKTISDPCDMTTDNTCTVVDGRISLYIKGTETDVAKEDCLDTIRSGMNGGNLLFAHESLRKLTFIQAPIDTLTDDDVTTITNDDEEMLLENDIVWTSGYLFGIIIGSTILFCSIIIARLAVKLPDEYEEDEEIGSTRWREISHNSSLAIVSDDDVTIHASNKGVDVSHREGLSDDYQKGEMQVNESAHFDDVSDSLGAVLENQNTNDGSDHDSNINDTDQQIDDDMEVNVDLESFQPKTREEKDGCFEFFDLILDATGINRQQDDILDEEDKSHMSELSF